MWNVLTKKYLDNFDIEIRDHKGHLFPRSAIADFVMVLMFEVVDEINENIDDVVSRTKPMRIVRVTQLRLGIFSLDILNNNGSHTSWSRFSGYD